MSFLDSTGRKKSGTCHYCGSDVELEEYESWNRDGHQFKWMPSKHRAPCGAHCSGGGYEHGETDVHIPAFGACPRCGETDTEIVHTIENGEGNQRVVFHKYTISEEDYRIDLEIQTDEGWIVDKRWGTNHPDSLSLTIEWAENYVPWLKEL